MGGAAERAHADAIALVDGTSGEHVSYRQLEEQVDTRPRLVLLLSVEEAGKALGVSRSTVNELIGSGDLEVVHVRRSVRVPVDALHNFVRRLRAG